MASIALKPTMRQTPKSRAKRKHSSKTSKTQIAAPRRSSPAHLTPEAALGQPKLQPGLPLFGRPTAGHIAAAAALAILIAGIYGAIAWGLFTGDGDFRAHIDYAKVLYDTGRPPVPHFLLHALIAGLFGAHLAPSLVSAGRIVLLSSYVLTALLMYGLLWILFQKSGLGSPVTLFLAGLAILLAEPISRSHAYQLGYFWPEPYAIPTSALLKPFALAGFACTAWYLSRRCRIDGRLAVIFALATAAGSLSKPSFLICVAPATALLLVYRLALRLPTSPKGLLAGLYLPAAAVLGWQFYQTYSGHGTNAVYHDAIAWAPFKFMNYYATGLLSKFLLSILFPLAVAILYWKQASRDAMLQLAWLCFLFGAFYSYVLVEKTNWFAGNFTWSGCIGAFILFAGSAVFWLRRISSATPRGWLPWRALLCGAILALHAICGARMDWLYLTHYGCAEDYHAAEFVCRS